MKPIFLLLFTFFTLYGTAQTARQWSESDRNYLTGNLIRTRDLIVKETTGLTNAQWNFKETPDRWSIKEVVEHIGIWELLFQNEISQALAAPAIAAPAVNTPDSVLLGYTQDKEPKVTVEYTKPFTYGVPMGLGEGADKVAWLLKLRNESVGYLKTTTENLHLKAMQEGHPNVHQLYIFTFGHAERHLRQIQKIKGHANYPK